MKDKIPLSLYQEISLSVRGHVKIGTVQREGWTAPSDLYAFKCRDHGLVANTISGVNEVLKCPHCWEEVDKMTEKTNNENNGDERSFTFWFYLFAALTVALIIANQGISVESGHSLILMLLVKQMGITWRAEQEEITRVLEDERLDGAIFELCERLDKLDPYSDEKN